MSNIVKLKRSAVFNKTPLPSQLDYGELCLNFNSSNPFLSFKDSENEIQKFLSENKVRNLIADVKNDVDASFYTKAQINQMFEDLESGGTITFDDYYTKAESDAKYQSISGMSSYLTVASAEGLYQPKGDYALVSQLPDLTDYALKSELPDLTDYALKSEIPDTSNFADKSEIPDVSDFVTSAFTEATYAKKGEVPSIDTYTKSEADEKFQAQSGMTDYALKSEIPDTSNFAEKSEIPSIEGLASLSDLANYQPISGMSSYLTVASAESTYQPKGDYALVSQIPSVEGFVTSAYTEATYMKIGDVPTDVYTKSETDNLLAGKASSSHTHTASEIVDLDVPKIWKGTLAQYTSLTDIDPDTLYVITDESEQFVTSGEVESMISGYTTLSEVEVLLGGFSPTGHTHDYSEILNTPDLSGFASLSDIPDTSNFITSGFTDATYQPKGTYVVPSDLDDYALKTDLPTVPDSYTKTETDNLLAGKANSAHTHTVSEITDLVIPSLEGYATEAELANYQPVSGMSGYSQTGHTHDYSEIENTPNLSIYLTEHQDISGLATKAELENYQPTSGMSEYSTTAHTHSNYAEKSELVNYQPVSGMSDYALVSQIPSVAGLASETWVGQNFQPQSGMSEYSTTAHTHSYNDLTDKPTIPSTSGLASETWVTNNFAGTGHTHSQYLTQTSADSRYARVVSCTQAEYDALVQNDQVEQGVLYCIYEGSQSSSGDSGGSGNTGVPDDPIIPIPDDPDPNPFDF